MVNQEGLSDDEVTRLNDSGGGGGGTSPGPAAENSVAAERAAYSADELDSRPSPDSLTVEDV